VRTGAGGQQRHDQQAGTGGTAGAEQSSHSFEGKCRRADATVFARFD